MVYLEMKFYTQQGMRIDNSGYCSGANLNSKLSVFVK